jgi:hypothetical protein
MGPVDSQPRPQFGKEQIMNAATTVTGVFFVVLIVMIFAAISYVSLERGSR